MKHQYVGDVNDYRKYALLRVLAAGGTNRIGVCWMLTPNGGSDGGKLAYLGHPERYRHFDPELFDLLVEAAAEPNERRLASIEQSGIIEGATYFNDTLGDSVAARTHYMAAAQQQMADVDLVFFDPDNGLEISLRKGRKASSKFLYLDEAAAFYADGRSLLIYQHFPRIERETFIAACAERLLAAAPKAALWAFRTAHVVFLLVLNPNSSPALAAAVETAAKRWSPDFIRGHQIAPVGNALAQLLTEPEQDAATDN